MTQADVATPVRVRPSAFARGPRTRKTIAIGGVVLAALAVVVLVLRGSGKDAPASVTSDVPKRVEDAIEVPPSFLESARIKTTPALVVPLTPKIKVVGSVAFNPTHVAAVGTRVPGIVSKVFHVEGDVVEKGALLAVIEAPGLADAQAEMRTAEAKLRAARLDAERERDLLAKQLTTAREYEQAQAALAAERARAAAARERVEAFGGGKRMGLSELRAPVAGVIAERSIAPGQNVGEGLVAFRVGDVDELWVLLRVFERHVDLVRVGDRVEIRRVSDAREVFDGTISHVGAVLDKATRTADVRVTVTNGDKLRPGQAVDATIHASGPSHAALSVPTSAVTYVDGAPTVFVAETPTRFVPRQVELGIDGGDRVEIESGLREGEAVVSESVLALKSELFR